MVYVSNAASFQRLNGLPHEQHSIECMNQAIKTRLSVPRNTSTTCSEVDKV